VAGRAKVAGPGLQEGRQDRDHQNVVTALLDAEADFWTERESDIGAVDIMNFLKKLFVSSDDPSSS
jgi:hypothetical protein